MNFAAIPAEMQGIPNWVHWKEELRGNELTKPPYRAGQNVRASDTNPLHWVNFETAVHTLNGDGRGLGWVVSAETGIVFVDLDDCVTAGTVAPWAKGIVDRLRSYTEVSPSGEGLHIFIRGTLPAGARKRGALEMYSEARYATMTGNHLEGTPLTIEAADIVWLHRLLSAGVFDFEKNPALQSLMAGDTSAYGNDDSRADLALCSRLAALHLSESDIDSAFRPSGLMREKWERTDYRERTIATALEGRTSTPPVEQSWRAALICTKTGPRAVLANALIALRTAPEWAGVLTFDEFSLRITAAKPTPWNKVGTWGDDDNLRVCDWLHHQGIFAGAKVAAEAVSCAAREHGFHPVRRYLESLVWDGQPRIEDWLIACAGAPDDEYTRAVSSRWLISCIARIHRPGCQCDHCLVLLGDQGILKSTLLRELCGDQWFTDHISDLGNKDSRIEMLGRWIIELSELSAITRAEVERVKSFLTCRVDTFRPPYGRVAESVPRQCTFAATSNKSEILTDETGGRRFWPVECTRIDLDAIRNCRDQLWAESLHQYRAGAPWWLESQTLTALAKVEQEKHFEAGPYDDLLQAWINSGVNERRDSAESLPWHGSSVGRVNVTDALIHGIKLAPGHFKDAERRSVCRFFRHLNWTYKQDRSTGRYRGVRYWVSPTPPNYFGGCK